jgi:hypothetical protein
MNKTARRPVSGRLTGGQVLHSPLSMVRQKNMLFSRIFLAVFCQNTSVNVKL